MTEPYVYVPEQTSTAKKGKRSTRHFAKGMLFLFPSLFLFTVFLFYPMIRTLYLSFFLTDNRGMATVFVGFENFMRIFTSDLFLKSLTSTFLFVLYTVPGTILISLFLAIIANERLRGIGIFRMVFSSTMGISVAAASVFWLFLFHPSIGFLNQLLGWLNVGSIGWLTDPKWALFSVSVSTIWMNIGFTFLILLGGLQSIDRYLYESADIDGASYFYKLRRITIPMLSPTLFFVVTVTMINAFQTFGQIDMLTRGGPQNETNLIVYSIYREAFVNYQYGTASAQAVVLFAIILLMTIVQFKLGEKKVHYQ
ncbi:MULTISPECIES: carbohydrate ABC transporter permease [Shouchella]|jgi:sn-glycerol 3-phosphate transport system permease protein|uniref:Sugar ABC transporter permease n=1 Tax=Shouchella clausii TaxID=79880 RepID=A0A268S587_SHOCL|nr:MULTISPECIES: sugar ABC transporter permease [Shouchella]PAD43485.1 sugar ABC transporter permease [Bacillus sp. 7520-S]SPU19033.1 glycerol-3-phosphate ABC transporter permease [Niallia circulans]AST95309.1 glycerol-3-phosphate ABC transporter permease [Shouchella clausii]MBU8595468.1 sugar ABC transporter permease [Shouchella clausii]MCM3548860.1 sugar ABC transporter permease [Shouchella clausii]